MAVDGTGSLFTYNGSSWSTPSDVDGQTPIVSLSCAPGSSFCVAIDGRGDALTFNGTSWSAAAQVGNAGLDSVSCASLSFCVAVDDHGDEVGFDGKSWSTPVAIAKSGLVAVSCAASSYCLAISSNSDVLSLGTQDSFPQAPVKLGTSLVRVHRDRFLYLPMTCPKGPRDCDGKISVYVSGIKQPIVTDNILLGAGYPRVERLFFTKARFTDLIDTEGHRFTVTVKSPTGAVLGKLTLVLS